MPSKPAPLKTCTCGLSYSAAEWARLRLVGYSDVEEYDDQRLELRQCTACFSTIAIDLGPRPVSLLSFVMFGVTS